MLNTNSTQTKLKMDREATAPASFYSEVEVPSQKNYEKDVITQFRANLSQLEDLHSRLRFVMSEVADVLKKRS